MSRSEIAREIAQGHKPLFSRFSLWLCIAAAEILALETYGRIFQRLCHGAPFAMPADLSCFNAYVNLAVHPHDAALGAAPCPFLYPPPFLLLALPLHWLSARLGYIAWSLAGVAALVATARLIRIGWWAITLGLTAPATLMCLIIGQTGAFTSSLLLISLGLAARHPVVAGIAAGALIIKPQLALLLPVCFLARGNWRAIIAAASTAGTLALIVTLFFGGWAWPYFWHSQMMTAAGILDMPWPQPFQHIMISPFMTLRSLGVGLRSAGLGQAMVTALAALSCWRLWRQATPVTPRHLALTLCLTAMATPYAYVYDLPALGFALAAGLTAPGWRSPVALALFWLLTGAYTLISCSSFLLGAPVLGVLAVMLTRPFQLPFELTLKSV